MQIRIPIFLDADADADLDPELFDVDADPDQTFHPDENPDSIPAPNKG
jgi:hypothetical protein